MWIDLINGCWCVCDNTGILVRCASKDEALRWMNG